MEKDLSKLLNLIITEEDRRIVASLINELIQNIYQTGSSFDKILESNTPYGEVISRLLPPDYHNIEDKRVLESTLQDIKNKITEIKSVNLTLAIYPTAKVLDTLASFAQKNITEKQVFDIEVNPDILGGIILVREGKYYDHSLLSKLNSVFETKKEEIIQMAKQ